MKLRQICAVLLCGLAPLGAVAQSANPPCETSTGQPGRLFTGMFGYIAVPHSFDTAAAVNGTVSVVPRVRSALGPLVMAQGSGETTVRFFEKDALVYECAINAVPFDPELHGMDGVTEGNCDWITQSARPVIAGIGQIYALPQAYEEIASSDPDIADLTPLIDDTIYVLGREKGAATLLVVSPEGAVQSQCPVIVAGSAAYFADNPPTDAALCTGADGAKARLTVGETLSVSFGAEDTGFNEIATANPGIADVRVNSARSYDVVAKAPGITNITGLTEASGLHHECLVVVE